jgi:hypothetical protein
MATHVRRVVRTVEDRDTDLVDGDRNEVVVDRVNPVERAIYLIGGILLSLLALRVIFALLGANPDNGIADFVYTITYPFVAPFFGLFGYDVQYGMQYGIARLEIETIVAMFVYALIIWGLAQLATIGDRRRV